MKRLPMQIRDHLRGRRPVPVALRTVIRPFDFETENTAVEMQMERAMRNFDYAAAGCALDTTPERVFYFFHDCKRFWKYIRPMKKLAP